MHDVSHHYLQTGPAPGSSTWGKQIALADGAKGTAAPQDFSFVATTARVWRWVVTGVHPSGLCAPAKHCQADVAEVEFHKQGAAKGDFMKNSGTASESLVVSSSGGDTPENQAWKGARAHSLATVAPLVYSARVLPTAVDGKLLYVDFMDGWDDTLQQQCIG